MAASGGGGSEADAVARMLQAQQDEQLARELASSFARRSSRDRKPVERLEHAMEDEDDRPKRRGGRRGAKKGGRRGKAGSGGRRAASGSRSRKPRGSSSMDGDGDDEVLLVVRKRRRRTTAESAGEESSEVSSEDGSSEEDDESSSDDEEEVKRSGFAFGYGGGQGIDGSGEESDAMEDGSGLGGLSSSSSDSDDDFGDDGADDEDKAAKRKRKLRASKKKAAKKAARKKAEEIAASEQGGFTIERVLDHRLDASMAKDKEGGKEGDADEDEDEEEAREVEWDRFEFLIKWKNFSHIHSSWEKAEALMPLAGSKRLQNYMKREEEDLLLRRDEGWTAEDVEFHAVEREMEKQLWETHKNVERVFGTKVVNEGRQFLCKWEGLPYAEATWEDEDLLTDFEAQIDAFYRRESTLKDHCVSTEEARRRLGTRMRGIKEQPEWMGAGNPELRLRDYQIKSLEWMAYSWASERNVILADEMGLGKTIQTASILGYLLYEQRIGGPFLVVVPLSTLPNWARELARWLPDMNCVTYIGDAQSRRECRLHEFGSGKGKGKGGGRPYKFHVLLTTYETVMRDAEELGKITWAYMAIDEAHRLKNSETALYKTLFAFRTKARLLVTGTPLQNSLRELWALLHFLMPGDFRNADAFIDQYSSLQGGGDGDGEGGHVEAATSLSALHKELSQYLLRRVVKDVERSLPAKQEKVLRVEMSPLQKQYYKNILERNFADLNKGVKAGNQVSLLNIVNELKKTCNHPFLFASAVEQWSTGGGSFGEQITLASGKMQLLDKLLKRLLETGHRVLIFSQMVKMLDLIASYLSMRMYKFQRLDGSTRADKRQQAMDHFNAPGSDDFVFLLSTRAGGLGVNLATADTVIIFDSDWNPQNDLQAVSRAHRIGQTKSVNIYRFLTSNSVEEDILERAKRKMVLDHLVIQRMDNSGRMVSTAKVVNRSVNLSKEELAAVLKFGAEDLFKGGESNVEDSSKHAAVNASTTELDLDAILERAETVAEHKPTQGEELLNSFSVANVGKVEDDDGFWSRLMGVDPDAPDAQSMQGEVKLGDLILAPRSRKVVNYKENGAFGGGGDDDWGAKNKKGGGGALERPVAGTVVAFVDAATETGGDAKKDIKMGMRGASALIRAVKRWGTLPCHYRKRAEEVEGADSASGRLSEADMSIVVQRLMNACVWAKQHFRKDPSLPKEQNIALVEFYGVRTRAGELLQRASWMDAVAAYLSARGILDRPLDLELDLDVKPPAWASDPDREYPWTSAEDARLVQGVFLHGYASWEPIRNDERLDIARKVAGAQNSSSRIEARVNSLLRKIHEVMHEPAPNVVGAGVEKVQVSRPVPAPRQPGMPKPKPSARVPARDRDGPGSKKWCKEVLGELQDVFKAFVQNSKAKVETEDDKRILLANSKMYLARIGDFVNVIVEKFGGESQEGAPSRDQVSTAVWEQIAVEVGKKGLGDRLSAMYERVKAKAQEDSKAAAQSALADAVQVAATTASPAASPALGVTQPVVPAVVASQGPALLSHTEVPHEAAEGVQPHAEKIRWLPPPKLPKPPADSKPRMLSSKPKVERAPHQSADPPAQPRKRIRMR